MTETSFEALPADERLVRMRHSAAHVLAEAMVELMPEAELGIGPPIESGFYYDFRLPRPLTEDDAERVAELFVAALGEGWRLETPHEAFADIDYAAKNAHGAISRDENRTADPYWTCQPYPLDPAARVVVWFDGGYVYYSNYYYRARARAVRVAGQSSAL